MLSEVTVSTRTVERIDTLAGFRALESDWQQLLLTDNSHTIFQTHHWLLSWWETFGAYCDLYLIVVRDDGALAAIAPLMQRRMSRFGPARYVVEFLGTPNIDYCDIIAADKESAWVAVLNYLAEHRGTWDRIDLRQISERSQSRTILDLLLQSPDWHCRRSPIDTCLAYEFCGTEAERAAFKTERGPHFRKKVRVLNNMGAVVYRRLPPEEAADHLTDLFQLHISRWMSTPTPSKFLKPEHRRFYQLLVERLAPLGQLAFTYMTCGDLPVCCSFNYEYRGVIYHYTAAHNPYFACWSPGSVFLGYQAEQFVHGGFVLDYSRGVQGYKKLLANRTYLNYRYEIYSTGLALYGKRLTAAVRQNSLIRRILDHPTVVDFRERLAYAKSTNGSLGTLWRTIRKVCSFVWESRTFQILEFSGEINRSIVPAIDVTMRQLTEQDLPAVCSLYGVEALSRKYQTFQKRFQSGAECWGGFHKGRLISIGWCIFTEDIDSATGFAVTADPGQVIMADGYSSPLYRGLRVRPYLINQELEIYRTRGLKVITAVDIANTASMHNVARIGFRKTRRVRLIRLFGIRVV